MVKTARRPLPSARRGRAPLCCLIDAITIDVALAFLGAQGINVVWTLLLA